ncbi:hypothetical protein FGG08_002539 [Glutinoglossum americanum]|uniref:4-coumarate--CoA ligase n=1 Tax=Glutinoglossum americanum TaxID=1670608 RepID=A0A9P8ICP6_9PEZI|nr:hypothetical protein FGG08_002539 [Glutinoglossum americanum]
MIARSAVRAVLSPPRLAWRVPKLSQLSTTCALPNLPILEAIASHDPETTAVVHSSTGRRFTYGELLRDIVLAKDRLNASTKEGGLKGKAVGFIAERSYNYVVTLLSILANQSIAVPLAATFPATELRHLLDECQASTLLLRSQKDSHEVLKACEDGLASERLEIVSVEDFAEKSQSSPGLKDIKWKDAAEAEGGIMLFTSGTTSRPKGVLLSQPVLTSQSQSLVLAWKYAREDHLLHILPLHHIHGILNTLLAPLFVGARVEFMGIFNSTAVWERLASPYLPTIDGKINREERITFLTAVPTIYSHLLSRYPELPSVVRPAAKEAVSPKNLRLNISGSAALPTQIKSSWKELSSGNVLLERYGMTEVGMALSCGLDFKDRVDGAVGWPLPSVEARLVDVDSGEVIEPGEEFHKNGNEREGEIQLRGPTIFKGYWRNPKATEESFVEAQDGKGKWFKTGDVAIRKPVREAGESEQEWAKGPMYFIKGRKSVDIIKTGGEKVSALEVERELLSMYVPLKNSASSTLISLARPQFVEAAVVGLPSVTFGQIVAAVVVLNSSYKQQTGYAKSRAEIRGFLKGKLARHQIPQKIKVVDKSLPRNAMGKVTVNKKVIIEAYFPEQ